MNRSSTVRHFKSSCVPSLNGSAKTMSLCCSCNIDKFAFAKHITLNFVADIKFCVIVNFKFSQIFLCFDISLFEKPHLRFIFEILSCFAKRDNHCFVSIFIHGLLLDNDAWSCKNNCNWCYLAVKVENLCHS